MDEEHGLAGSRDLILKSSAVNVYPLHHCDLHASQAPRENVDTVHCPTLGNRTIACGTGAHRAQSVAWQINSAWAVPVPELTAPCGTRYRRWRGISASPSVQSASRSRPV